MDWSQLHKNIAYGFSGVLPPGIYLIGDIQLLKTDEQIPDGIWQCDESLNGLSVLTTGLGYFKVYDKTKSKTWRGGVEQKIGVISSDMALKIPNAAYAFQATGPVTIRANEIYGTFDIKFDNEHIIVSYEDPASEEDEENLCFYNIN
jgi:hypothetical protein